MANEEHLVIFKQGVEVWNRWREKHKDTEPDLQGIKLQGANLQGINFQGTKLQRVNFQSTNLYRAKLYGAMCSDAIFYRCNLEEADLERSDIQGTNLQETKLQGANLLQANLQWAILEGANLTKANFAQADLRWTFLEGVNLSGTNLQEANLEGADLRRATLERATLMGANLQEANFEGANFAEANLEGANFTEANLQRASFIQVSIDDAILIRSNIYGLSVWDIRGTPRDQSSLLITPPNAPTITVDDLEVAQFIYLLLNRQKLRNVINTITAKAVLILGRFTLERKAVLDAMADELRKHNLLPIIFDFEGATTRDITETIKTLAGLSLFVIADITNPKSAPLELQATVPDYQIPFVAIIQQGERPFAMFSDLPKYPWVLTPVIEYSSVEKLLQGFKQGVIDRAWAKHQELVKQKNKTIETQSIEDFVREDEG